MNVKLVTLKTNHTILADLNVDGEVCLLKEPVQVIMQPTKEGPMMAFSPFLDYCQEFKTGIRIHEDNILCITTPMREVENQYNQIFGSGIQIASSIPKV